VRVREGDEASCLNLNQAQTPHLFGIDPANLAGRFTITSTIPSLSTDDGWEVLNATLDDGAIPAVADQGSLQWALKGSVGMTLDYKDDAGNTVKVRIVGVVASSIFQGRLIISEGNFEKLFPDESGYRVLLVDAPKDEAKRDAIAMGLAFGLGEEYGLELSSAAHRLEQFNAVENTYLAIFQMLGFLGLLLGSIGLGIVVARNILERRGELGLMRAIGFNRPAIYWMVLSEHWLLLLLGVLSGVVAAALAVMPAMAEPGRHVPYATMSITLAAVLVSGIIWVVIATWAALRGNLVEALRSE
jgi:ABC-type antimicrobial peptide transport system permease subunit